jgi:DNA repair photolyase
VYLSPSADPFPPLGAIQAAAASVVEVLAARGVEAWFMTRGLIRPSVLRSLATHRAHVRVTVALTTLDRTLQRTLEPLAAPPRLRLRQLASLRELGITTQVALEPLVPGWTDSRANVRPLLEALAALGVRHVSAGYLFLRPAIAENLRHALGDEGADTLLAAFASGPILAAGSIAPARYLPKPYRQRGYAALMALGAELGITVGVSGTANPDFAASRPSGQPVPHRRALFPLLS